MYLLNPYWYTRQYSAPVSNYLDQVIDADVAAGNLLGLEDGTKTAYATFIDNLIVDGYLGVSGGTISQASSVMKASPIMAGARTLAGALVPLVGAAPTNFNFVSGDYNRKTGLGDPSNTTKYLDSNRANNADPQNSNHNACWVSTPANGALMASSITNTGRNYMDITSIPSTRFSNRTNLTDNPVFGAAVAGLYGHSRTTSTAVAFRCPQGNGTATHTSQTPESRNVFLYTRSNDSVSFSTWSSARLAFYSIGESLNLALLDTRVTALINAFAAAIP